MPILMPESRVAYLFMMFSHCGEYGLVHRSVVSTLARSRRYVWVVRGRDLARKIVNSCPQCDRDRKEMMVQQMSDIKAEQLTVAPPWTNVAMALDFAGPVVVKGQVNNFSQPLMTPPPPTKLGKNLNLGIYKNRMTPPLGKLFF